MIPELPVLGVCGYSGSGKTVLLEQVVPVLRRRGLLVAVVKHDAYGADVDRPGKDSARLFQAGADVMLQDPQQQFVRVHGPGAGLEGIVRGLTRDHDLVLVEGHKHSPLPKVWLAGKKNSAPPRSAGDVRAVLAPGPRRSQQFLRIVKEFLSEQWRSPPLLGCVLIGGKSRRMGTPKHLLRQRGHTWLEKTINLLDGVCPTTVIVGDGFVPASLKNRLRLPDALGAQGPMAGVLAAMRWSPWARWLVAACDLPRLTPQALRWLSSKAVPGIWATLPRTTGNRLIQPLLAHYDFRAGELLEELAAAGNYRLSDLGRHPKVACPTVPHRLTPAWSNVNTPDELP